MANIEPWIKFIHKWEGGFRPVIVEHDNGGLTNNGITLDAWKSLAPRLEIGTGTADELRRLTEAQWRRIVKWFWDDIQGDKIKNQAVAELVADIRWGSGNGGIKWIVQPTLNRMGNNLVTDGGVGAKTLAAINNANPERLFKALNQARWNFLLNFMERDPNQKKFGAGWHNRLADQAWEFGFDAPTPFPKSIHSLAHVFGNSKKKRPQLPPEGQG